MAPRRVTRTISNASPESQAHHNARSCSRMNVACAGIVLLSIGSATEGRGQPGFYARAGLELAQVQPSRSDLELSADRHPSVAVGRLFREHRAVELRLNRIAAEGTIPSRDGPTTLGVRATIVELGYVHRVRVRRMESRAGAGLLWIPATYSWESDTPAETDRKSLVGVSSSLALGFQLPGSLKAFGRGAYQLVHAKRSPTHIGLNGFRLEGGLEFGR
jgi:hypothetical protein